MNRYGLIIPVCTQHSMQAESFRLNRLYTRVDTDCIVLMNGGGAEGIDIPDGYEVLRRGEAPFTDEADLWHWALGIAVERNWAWTMIVHDDFAMQEPGWEDDLDAAEGWRVATASWCVFSEWDAPGGSKPSVTPLGVCIDPMSFGIKTAPFVERGTVTTQRFGFGFAAWDACAWALDNGYGAWRILRSSAHQWEPENSRAKLRVGAPGHPELTQSWMAAGVIPAWVYGTEIVLGGGVRRFDAAPPSGATVAPRGAWCMLNWGTTIMTDGETGESLHYRLGELMPGPYKV